MVLKKWKIYPTFSFLEEDFINLNGEEIWKKVKHNAVSKFGMQCCSCGYNPPNKEKRKNLNVHIIDVNQNSPELSESIILCSACHLIQHIDKAVEGKKIKFANSTYSQGEINRFCRNGEIKDKISNKEVILFNTTEEKVLENIRSGMYPDPTKIKIVFTDKFDWSSF